MIYLSLFLTILPWTLVIADCPDGEPCDPGYPCCKSPSGGYFCCPIMEGYCCPDGHSCSNIQSACKTIDHNYTSSLVANNDRHLKVPADKVDTVCPGGRYTCPDDNTCCPSGSYFTCCPYPSAVCCTDGIHCCPTHYICDLVHNLCHRANDPPLQRANGAAQRSLLPIEIQENQVCPDGSQCSNDETCCNTSPSSYSCCPFSRATCCVDYIHCCPYEMKCNLSSQTCNSGSFAVPWYQHLKAVDKHKNVCPDGKSSCPNGSTCCKLLDGQWGCCPYENATCCDDGIHCCPSGDKCNTEAGRCESQLHTVPMLKKQKAVYFRKSFP